MGKCGSHVNGIQIAGGWGRYDNLGNEVILASYLEYLHHAYGRSEAEIECLTVMPKKTQGAQRPGTARYTRERLLVARRAGWTGPLLLGGRLPEWAVVARSPIEAQSTSVPVPRKALGRPRRGVAKAFGRYRGPPIASPVQERDNRRAR